MTNQQQPPTFEENVCEWLHFLKAEFVRPDGSVVNLQDLERKVLQTMADLATLKADLTKLQADVTAMKTNLTKQIADLKAQLAAGTGVTQADLDALDATINATDADATSP